MDIDTLSDHFEILNIHIHSDEPARWNRHGVRELKRMNFPATILNFSINFEGTRSLAHYKVHKEPCMSRPPDESQASIEAGYDEKRGAFVEGKWTWTWNDVEDKDASSNSDQGPAPSAPPDSNDREFDTPNVTQKMVARRD